MSTKSPKRPTIGTYWKGPLGLHEIISVTKKTVTVAYGYRKSKQAPPPSLKSPPPTTDTYDLALYMANQKPNERTEGGSYARTFARQLAGQKDKSKKVVLTPRPG